MTDKKRMKIVFMGTPQIACDCLQQLVTDGYNIKGVFTRQDKPVGRKQILTPPPTKVYAQQNNIPVFQPQKITQETADIIKEINPDLIVVVAYGRILPQSVLSIPKFGCVNLHVSLLPKYRGAAPIQWALINGDTSTGVTVMHIDQGLDTGDIIDVLPIDVDNDETQEQLFAKVSEKGKVFLSKVCQNILDGKTTRTPQQHENATLAPPLSKERALFCFDEAAQVLHNKIRGQNPWPGAYFICDDKRVKVLKAKLCDLQGKKGEILSLKPLVVACKQNALELITVQPEGSKPMDGFAFCLGKRFAKGDIIKNG